MKYDSLGAWIAVGIFVFVLCFISSGLISRFAKGKVTLREAFMVALLAWFPSIILMLALFVTIAQLQLSRTLDSIAVLVGLCAAGAIITRQLRKYDVQKTGWFGVGAKVVFSFVVLSWVITLIGLGLSYLFK